MVEMCSRNDEEQHKGVLQGHENCCGEQIIREQGSHLHREYPPKETNY